MTTEKQTLDQSKLEAEIANIIADTEKKIAEVRKLKADAFAVPFFAGAAAFGSIAAFVKIFL